jgi:meso-butanediol dehydrogenase/(S,S)-butanediol dehydrogenase/diacetyl reductase
MTMYTMSGKNVVVTGATSGIGEAIARRFAAEGATVALVGRRTEEGERAALKIESAGGRAVFIRADVASSSSVEDMATACLEKLGSISVLVNNAGVSTGNAMMERVTEEDWDKVMDTNAKGTFLCCKALVPAMVKSGGGSVVNISSGGGLRPYVGGTVYASSKAAVIMLTKVLALEHGKDKIRANCICPGSIRSEMFESGIRSFVKRAVEKAAERGKEGGEGKEEEAPSTERIIENIAKGIPLGRLGEPDDVAGLAVFLSSEQASFINGAVVVIDGGQLL